MKSIPYVNEFNTIYFHVFNGVFCSFVCFTFLSCDLIIICNKELIIQVGLSFLIFESFVNDSEYPNNLKLVCLLGLGSTVHRDLLADCNLKI